MNLIKSFERLPMPLLNGIIASLTALTDPLFLIFAPAISTRTLLRSSASHHACMRRSGILDRRIRNGNIGEVVLANGFDRPCICKELSALNNHVRPCFSV
jgi:hypothetical protein